MTSSKVGPRGVAKGRPSSSSSYVHSKGHNTGAPSAEPFVLNAIGTFTTEEEVLAGIHRTKLFGRNETSVKGIR